MISQDGGSAALDAMVTDLGGSAGNADAKMFVRSAIGAKYGTQLTDNNLTSKYLPRLYDVLGKVPASHTRNNPRLKTIDRASRTTLISDGSYDGDTNTIELNVTRTGLMDSIASFGARRFLPDHNAGVREGGSVFDSLTLHEVGHAVDEQKGFMSGKLGNTRFGGWQSHTVDEVADVIAAGKGLFTAFPDVARPFLKEYLKAVLQKNANPRTAVASRADKPADTHACWRALPNHAAIKHAKAIVLNGSSDGLWEKKDAGASTYAIGTSVFQESYGGKWVSYALSARGAKVSDYQWRSPDEWFAEAYAAFFMDTLPEGHPVYPTLQADRAAEGG
jgi:hypothetical protein